VIDKSNDGGEKHWEQEKKIERLTNVSFFLLLVPLLKSEEIEFFLLVVVIEAKKT
jgi:hypothetical protein